MSQKNFQPPGVGETSQSVSIFILVILQGKMVKTAHVEGGPRGPSWCSEVDSSSRHLRWCPNIDVMESNQFFSSPGVARSLLTDSFLQDFLTGKKLSVWVLETWDQHQKMPVNGGILIYVPHLGSSTSPWWATRWTTTRTSLWTSTGNTLLTFFGYFFQGNHLRTLSGIIWRLKILQKITLMCDL